MRCGSEPAPKSTPKVCTRDFWPDLQPGPSRLLSSRAESGSLAPPSIRLHLLYLMILTVRSSSDTPRLHAYSPESSQFARPFRFAWNLMIIIRFRFQGQRERRWHTCCGRHRQGTTSRSPIRSVLAAKSLESCVREGNGMARIDVDDLRDYLLDYCGTAAFRVSRGACRRGRD